MLICHLGAAFKKNSEFKKSPSSQHVVHRRARATDSSTNIPCRTEWLEYKDYCIKIRSTLRADICS